MTTWAVRTVTTASWFPRGQNIAPYRTTAGYWVFLPRVGNGQFVAADDDYFTLQYGAVSGRRMTKVASVATPYVRFA